MSAKAPHAAARAPSAENRSAHVWEARNAKRSVEATCKYAKHHTNGKTNPYKEIHTNDRSRPRVATRDTQQSPHKPLLRKPLHGMLLPRKSQWATTFQAFLRNYSTTCTYRITSSKSQTTRNLIQLSLQTAMLATSVMASRYSHTHARRWLPTKRQTQSVWCWLVNFANEIHTVITPQICTQREPSLSAVS